MILLLLSTSIVGIISSLLFYISGVSFFLSLDVFICSLISLFIFFSILIIQKNSPKYTVKALYTGLIVDLLLIYGITHSQSLSSIWPIAFSGLIFLIVAAIEQLLKDKKDVTSKISKVSFWITGSILIFTVLTSQSNPLFYSIISSSLFIGSITLIIASLKNTVEVKE